MKRALLCLALIALCSPGGFPAQGLTGIIVDTAGVQTEVTDLNSNWLDSPELFRSFGSRGLWVIVKDFTPPSGSYAHYLRWLYFDEIDTMSIAKGGAATIRLRTGATITGPLKSPQSPLVLGGNWTGGRFELSVDKIKSLTVRGTAERVVAAPIRGPKATVVLRDGTTLKAESVTRYSGVPWRGFYDHSSVWIEYKRGAGHVRTELPFERIREIEFGSGSGNLPCEASLRDGSVLSGECSPSGSETLFVGLRGYSDIGPFPIDAYRVRPALRSIRFAE